MSSEIESYKYYKYHLPIFDKQRDQYNRKKIMLSIYHAEMTWQSYAKG